MFLNRSFDNMGLYLKFECLRVAIDIYCLGVLVLINMISIKQFNIN